MVKGEMRGVWSTYTAGCRTLIFVCYVNNAALLAGFGPGQIVHHLAGWCFVSVLEYISPNLVGSATYRIPFLEQWSRLCKGRRTIISFKYQTTVQFDMFLFFFLFVGLIFIRVLSYLPVFFILSLCLFLSLFLVFSIRLLKTASHVPPPRVRVCVCVCVCYAMQYEHERHCFYPLCLYFRTACQKCVQPLSYRILFFSGIEINRRNIGRAQSMVGLIFKIHIIYFDSDIYVYCVWMRFRVYSGSWRPGQSAPPFVVVGFVFVASFVQKIYIFFFFVYSFVHCRCCCC